MDLDLIDLYDRGSAWTVGMVPQAAEQLDAPTPCEGWDVRTLLNHVLQVQCYFRDHALGKEGGLTAEPPDLIGDDPVGRAEAVRADMLRVYGEDGVLEQSGPMLGIAFSDVLVHGWDLARATGQDATMPAGLADAAYRDDPRAVHARAASGAVRPRARGGRGRVGAGPAARLHRT